MDRLQTLLDGIREQQKALTELSEHSDKRSGTHEGCVDGHAVASVASGLADLLAAYDNPQQFRVHSGVSHNANLDLPLRWRHLPREIAMRRQRQSRKNKRDHKKKVGT